MTGVNLTRTGPKGPKHEHNKGLINVFSYQIWWSLVIWCFCIFNTFGLFSILCLFVTYSTCHCSLHFTEGFWCQWVGKTTGRFWQISGLFSSLRLRASLKQSAVALDNCIWCANGSLCVFMTCCQSLGYLCEPLSITVRFHMERQTEPLRANRWSRLVVFALQLPCANCIKGSMFHSQLTTDHITNFTKPLVWCATCMFIFVIKQIILLNVKPTVFGYKKNKKKLVSLWVWHAMHAGKAKASKEINLRCASKFLTDLLF